jgi:hypothetical protein
VTDDVVRVSFERNVRIGPRPPDLATSPTPSRRSPIVWDQLDQAARIAALELLARMIARMMAEVAVKGDRS